MEFVHFTGEETEKEFLGKCLKQWEISIEQDPVRALMQLGSLIGLEERYEALLELLPQSSFSKAGTHPQWVADAVEENTLNKMDTQSDVKDMLKDADDIDDLKEMMIEYFELDKNIGG